MSEGSKWTPGKIVLLVVGILFGLGVLCCGGVWFVAGDKIMAGFKLAKDMTGFVTSLQKELGPGTSFQLVQNGRAKFILAVGVDGELTPERVAQVQDTTWKLFAEAFRKDGFVPITHVAVGRPDKGKGGRSQTVSDWSENQIAVADVVKRTGVAEPPVSSLIPQEHGLEVHVQSDGASTDETKDKEDGGGGRK